MKASASQLRTAIDRGDPHIRLYLLYGPDDAGANDWATRLARQMGTAAERLDIEPSMLKVDPALLAAEAASTSLFATARHIKICGIGDESLEAVSLLLSAERAGNPVLAIAPQLKATSKLVKLALAAPNALCCACYPSNAAEAARLAASMAQEQGMRINPALADRLVASSGGDRAVMAREIEKLALFVDASPEHPGIADEAAFDAIGADLGDSEFFRAIDAAIDGRIADLGSDLAQMAQAGVSPIPLLRGLVKRLMTIAALRADVDTGININDAMDRHYVHIRERPVTARAVRQWPATRAVVAITRLREVERAMMASGSAGQVLADAICLNIARAARAR